MPVESIGLKKSNPVNEILKRLADHYPRVRSGLVYKNNYQLFVATVLSAQTTDEQVNRITGPLFEAVPDIFIMSALKSSELEPYLKSCGLYRHKSRYLIEASKIIVEKYSGRVPDNYDQLIKLPGVGRKTANVVISSGFGKAALAVDTHVFRVSKRIGLAKGKTVNSVEEELKELIPKDEWVALHHRLIAHGRALCQARSPKCALCFINDLCPYPLKGVNENDLEKT